jgi:acyl transferase domain-containing protein/acyl carrier protein/NAD(P)-dependent dehydrogenase (short-subunit alcohol dehydrogenase family)/ubiquinone/menaquinone biosynthesis C-methylase UbiE
MPTRGGGAKGTATAIVGMAGRFPGAADLAEFADLVLRGRDAVREIPPGRWSVEGFYDPDRTAPNRSVSRWCGVLDGIERFDNRFFAMSARDAATMDPQQRLLLETVWHAVEDAGLSPQTLRAGRTAVFCGVMATDFHQLLAQPGVEVEATAGLGAYGGILANRISHALGLTGASVTVDAACASSLVALHQACRALAEGDCDHAIVAAASLNLDPWKYLSFSKAGMLSPTGRCRTFDAGADGYVPGDGVAAIVLKRASDAPDGRIRALVRGTAVNHSGDRASITHPSADAQERVIRMALNQAGLEPDDIDYVECHGTGTALGDPIEVEALNRVFAARPRADPCWLGSVKANIGHLEAAAGLAGLIKTVLMIDAGRFGPAVHLEAANPLCRFAQDGVQPVRSADRWTPTRGPRRAGVSSFGMGGVNAHAIVEEAPKPAARTMRPTTGPVPFLLSAADRDALAALIERWRAFAATDAFRAAPLADMAATLATGRAALACRIGLWAESHDAVVEWLANVSADEASMGRGPWLLAFAPSGSAAHSAQVPLMRPLLGKPGLFGRNREASPKTFLAALERLGVHPLAVTGTGSGLDRALATGGALVDPDARSLHGVPSPDTTYFRALLAAARAETAAVERLCDLGRQRSVDQPSFARQIEAWRPALAPHGLDLVALLAAPADSARLLAAVMTVVALREVAGRWDLAGQPRETGPVAELAELVHLGALPRSDLAETLLGGVEPVIGPLDLERQALVVGRIGDFPMLAARSVARPDARTLDSWRRREAPATAGNLHIVGRLDSAALARLALDLWLSGHGVDWSVVVAQYGVRRVALPLYPFQGRVFPTSRADFAHASRAPLPAAAPSAPQNFDEESAGDVRADDRAATLRDQLRGRIAALLAEPPERVGEDDSFFDLGLGSVQLQDLTSELGERFSGVTPTLLFQHTSIARLADHLATLPDTLRETRLTARPQPRPVASASDEPIAIIGMSGRFPDSPDIWALWQNLIAGHDAIRTVPQERWDGEGFKGGFIDDVARFEPLFFNISAREAERMDPQQRLALENVWTTLEHAGYGRREAHAGRNVGVFLGTMWSEYSLHADEHGRQTAEWGGPGALSWAIANRVSYALDLHGPSMAVDTACSSSLTAVHLAAQALRNGDCEMAVAGGVNLSIHPAKYRYLSEAHFLSSDGHCRSFGEGGDGYVPGEGVASVLLKPLSKALGDGDRVYGVLLGTSINHGGRAAGFTVPSPRAQQHLAETALARSGVDPATIGYVECHGTGTALGDPIEIEALAAAYSGVGHGSVAIGSIKSNIGHLEAAAGVAGLIKILLAFEHDHLPPSLHSEPPNSGIAFARTPFSVLREGRRWDRGPDTARHAALSSFGAGGANAHAILAGPESVQRLGSPQPASATVRVTARSATALAALCRRLAHRITEVPAGDLTPGRIAATLERRQAFDVGVEIEAGSLAQLADRLRDAALRVEKGEVGERLPERRAGGQIVPPCSLPGTPFDGEDYWIGGRPERLTTLQARSTIATSNVIGPTHATISLGLSHPLVSGHVIGGETVLAGAVALEEIRRAVAASGRFPQGFALAGLSWARAVEGGAPATISLAPDGERLRVAVEQDGGVCIRALAEPATSLDAHLAPAPRGERLDVDALYADFRQAGYDYGPEFRTLKRVHLTVDTAFADLVTEDVTSGLAPGLVDGALQLCLAWLRRKGVAAALPVGIERVRWSRSLPPRLTVEARLAEVGARGLWRADITGFADGRPCLQMDGIILREVDLTMLGKPRAALRFTTLAWRAEKGVPRAMPALAVVDLAGEARLLAEALGPHTPLVAPGSSGLGGSATLVVPLPDDDAALRDMLWPLVAFLRDCGPRNTVILTYRTGPKLRPDAGALSGLLRVLRVEMPGLDARLLEVAGAMLPDMTVWSRAVGAEAALHRPADPELRWSDGERLIRAEREVAAREKSALPVGGPWLIAGGLGGLGLLVAERLVQRGVPAIALIGRSVEPKTAEDRSRLDALRSRTRVLTISADVGDAVACESAVRRAVAELGPLTGVVHAAGVLSDGLLRSKQPEDFAAVLAPKLAGARNLDAATRDQELQAFVLFSSLTATRGNLGQSDYAYANRWLDLFAEARGANTVSIGWPLWREGGMRAPEDRLSALEGLLGSGVLETAAGLDAFEASLGLGQPHVAVSVPLAAPVVRPAPATAGAMAGAPEALRAHLLSLLSRITKIPVERLDPAEPVDTYGVDSVMALEFVAALEQDVGPLSKVLLFEHPTLDGVATLLAAERPEMAARFTPKALETLRDDVVSAPVAGAGHRRRDTPGAREPIAIIGLAGRFPGADDLDAFWRNLREGRDCVGEIPPGRWRDADWPAGLHGGVLEGIDLFDPLVFGISPKDARLMDPQARLFLETALHALEDAGYAGSVGGASVGVFAAAMWGQYELVGAGAADGPVPGSSFAEIANRVSHAFGLTGPSLAVDSMCSSSLTALHLACESLRRGECGMALAGGVNLSLRPEKYRLLGEGGFLSSDGRCRSFGDGGDGYVPGEGVAVALLKPLSRALADGDAIWGTIRGSALNHGGRARGYTVPNPNAQAAVISAALVDAGVEPADVGYVEAHGTGTALGDPIEIAGLAKAFGEAGGPWQIGSVKSQIGHLEAAAGMAGLAKVVLQMRAGEIAPTLHASRRNQAIDWDRTPFAIAGSASPWPAGKSRIAVVSSFGAGGSNGHLVVEEGPEAVARAAVGGGVQAVPISARTQSSLTATVERILHWLDGQLAAKDGRGLEAQRIVLAETLGVAPDALSETERLSDLGLEATGLARIVNLAGKPLNALSGVETVGQLLAALGGDTGQPELADIAFTLQTGRIAMVERLCLVAGNLRELRDALAAWLAGATPAIPCFQGRVEEGQAARAASIRAREAVAARDPAALAEAFVSGGDVDWQALHTTSSRRVRLPLYAFDRKRYWFEPEAARKVDRAAPAMAEMASNDEAMLGEWRRRARTYDGDAVGVTTEGGIAIVTLNRPRERNMLGEELALGLARVLDRLQEAPETRCVVIVAEGEAFSMGGTPEMLIAIASGEANFTDVPVFYRALLEFPLPVVTAMAGHAYGGGLLFGLYGDVPVLAEETLYAAIFADYGFTPGMGATLLLPQRLGAVLAGEMMMTARPFTGAELATRGASVKIVPRARVFDEAMSIARSLARKPRITLELMKRDLARPLLEGLDKAIARERAMHAESFHLPEVQAQLAQRFGAKPDGAVASAMPPVRVTPRVETAGPVADRAPAIRAALATVLMMEPDEVIVGRSFQEQGLDSIGAVEFVAALNRELGTALDVTELYDHPTVNALAAHLGGTGDGGTETAFVVDGDTPVAMPAVSPVLDTRPPVPAPAVSGGSESGERDAVAESEAEPGRIRLRPVGTRHKPGAATLALPRPSVSGVPRPATIAAIPAPPAEAAPSPETAVAIIGMAARFPGADDIATLWANLVAGADHVGEIPGDRWDAARHLDPDQTAHDRTVSRWGGFLSDVAGFDADFFGFSPMEAAIIDPQQRLVLEECWRALEDAAIAPSSLRGSSAGVFLGAAVGDYEERLAAEGLGRTAQAFTGLAPSVHAARIAYALDLTGPALAIDTACSSSLVAVHLARRALLDGDCDLALAGGVMVMTTPRLHVRSSQAGMLSPTGRCRPFSAEADGIALSEGVGMVVLKRLADAVRDGDPIRAVIRGSGIGQDGRTNGITAPSARSQAALIRRVLEVDAKLDPAEIGYVEAHGTGTPLGDPIELRALTEVFGDRGGECLLGSVKANIGHATTAAGIAGLIKATLAVEHAMVPPQIHLGRVNERIALDKGPFRIPHAATPWSASPRRAGVSSFGFSGTNAHVVIEQAPPSMPPSAEHHGPLTFILSARTQTALRARRAALAQWLRQSGRQVPLADIAFTLAAGRDLMEHRFAVLAETSDALIAALEFGHGAGVDADVPNVAATLAGARRIHLPPHDFDHSRHWVGEALDGDRSLPLDVADPLLADHRRNGRPILAAAASIVLALEVSGTRGLSDMRWHVPYGPDDQGALPALRLETEGERLRFVSAALDPDEAHVTARRSEPGPLSAAIDIAARRARAQRLVGREAFYAAFARKGLDLGPSFARATSFAVGDGWVLADIEQASGPLAGLLDSALQGVALLIDPDLAGERLHLPVGLDRFSVHGEIALVRHTLIEDRGEADGERVFDVLLLDGDGNGVAEANGFRLREVEGRAALPLPCLVPEWRDLALPAAVAGLHHADATVPHEATHILAQMQSETPETLFAEVAALVARLAMPGRRRVVTLAVNTASAARALAGFARSLALENPLLDLRVAQVAGSAQPTLEALAAADLPGGGALYRVTPGRVETLHFRQDLASAGPAPKLDGVWLIAGGLGRLGLALAGHMARRGARPVLVGRRAPDQATARVIAAMPGNPAIVIADLADPLDASRAVSEARAFGPLAGILHCAGTLRDGLLSGKAETDWQAVLAAKTTIAENLWHATQTERPPFIAFTSVSALRGQTGQTDYAFANGWLDGLAEDRGAAWRTMAWSWWRDGGMALDAETIEAARARDGIEPIETDAGLAAFDRVLAGGLPNAVLVAGDASRILASLNGVAEPRSASADVVDADGEALMAELGSIVRALLKLAPEAITPQRTFESYGFDSITLTRLAARMTKRFDCDITPAIFFEENTLAGLARLLLERFPGVAAEFSTRPAINESVAKPALRPSPEAVGAPERDDEPIAVIGMAGRFPGSPDLDSFWRNLAARRNLVSEIPSGRWDWRDFDGEAKPGSERTTSRWGGFIEGADLFDAKFFGISPREAELMDPQQRIFLETVWHAIEDAGLDPRSLSGSDTGLFTGVSTADYLDLLLRAGAPVEAHTATGLSHSMLPNRISYLLDLHGPSEPVDTACSSSLVAVARAVEAIRRGDCSMAIAGGVNLILSPTLHLAFGQAGMLSPTGASRTFDAAADGYVRGEGAGAVLLKPLKQAIADGDPIHGIIRSVKVAHGGRAASLTAPNPKAQAALIRSAMAQADVAPETVGYVETHGTGTSLGDPVEITALMQVLGEGMRSEPCRLGALKANIGHLEAAAGIAGLIKVLLALRHATVPGHPTFRQLNPHIRLDPARLSIAVETAPWSRIVDEDGYELPRRAGLSSFGFGGANAHAVVEEFVSEPGRVSRPARTVTPFNRQRFWAAAARSVRAGTAVPIERPAAALAELDGMVFEPFWRAVSPELDVEASGPALVVDTGGSEALASDVLRICGGTSVDAHEVSAAHLDGYRHIVWLDAEDRPDPRHPEGQSARQERGIIALFRCVQALSEAGRDDIRLTVLTRHATDHTGTAPSRPSAAAAIGLLLCLRQEQPRWRVHLCDLGPGGEDRLPEALRLGPGAPVLLGLGVDGFRERALRPASLVRESAGFGAHVLILGGAGGIGRAMADRFVRSGVSRVTLIGRRAETDAIRAQLADLQRLGAQASYIATDAGDVVALGAALMSITRGFGSIDTVVNATMVLQPARLAYMTEDEFRRAFAAKASVAVALQAAMVEAGIAPRRVLHMSSVQSLVGSVGHGNYAAGCSFLDAWAAGVGDETRCVSWGWWGSVGAVVDGRFRTLMEAAGGRSIEPDEGFAVLEQLVSGGARHLVAAKGTPEALSRFGLEAPSHATDHAAALDALEAVIPALVARRLRGAVQGAPAFSDISSWASALGTPDGQRRQLEAILAVAMAAGTNGADMHRLHSDQPSIAAHLDLLDAAIEGLPDVLTGRTDGASVLLPGGSSRLVEPIYRGNAIVDAANGALAEAVRAAVASGARRIIEIGAGTGGTTGAALSGIEAAGGEAAYTYTDLSRSFLRHGERAFTARLPGMEFRLLDITRAPREQGFDSGAHDVVIAANVLHATPDIAQALAHARTLLAPGGRLLLIELTRVLRFNTVTFGLLPGWWNAADPELRLPGSPLLDAARWRKALRQAGFADIVVQDHGAAVSLVTAVVKAAAQPGVVPDARAVTRVLAEVLRMHEAEIEPHAAFSDIGVDSILAGEVARRLGEETGLALKPTELFNHPSPDKLARHIAGMMPIAAAPAEAPSTAADDALADLLDRLESGARPSKRAQS